jgi:hypothetical protein
MRKKLTDFSFLHAANIGIPRIVDVIVIPNDKSIFLYHPEHLSGYLLFQSRV